MSKVKVLTYAVIALALLNVIMLGLILMPKGPGGKILGPKKGGIQTHFNFNEEQMAKFEESRNEIAKKLDALNNTLSSLSKSYYQMEMSGNENQKESLLRKISLANERIYKAHDKHFEDIRAICNPEQLGNVDEFIEILLNGGQGRLRGPRPGRK